jgi:hypothetical protein
MLHLTTVWQCRFDLLGHLQPTLIQLPPIGAFCVLEYLEKEFYIMGLASVLFHRAEDEESIYANFCTQTDNVTFLIAGLGGCGEINFVAETYLNFTI